MASSSSREPLVSMNLSSPPSRQYSIMKIFSALFSRVEWSLMTLALRHTRIDFSSLSKYRSHFSLIDSDLYLLNISALSISLMATDLPVARSLPWNTSPKEPFPRKRMTK